MPVYRIDERLAFPDPSEAEPSGLLAVGGDLSPERLLLAYTMGIFPWYNEGLPILWHSPDPRMAMTPADLHVPRSLAKRMRKSPFELTFDRAFEEVIEACANAPRLDQDGTWITREMIDAYVRLHDLGFAHSAEAWSDGQLVGGLYGVSLGSAFFGESMFTRVSDASKIAFVDLVQHLEGWGFTLVDCQVHTEHLERFGASEWPREVFLQALHAALSAETRRGQWDRD
jgi:leucyl/phenylalanyl-tRNA--protein transferase